MVTPSHLHDFCKQLENGDAAYRALQHDAFTVFRERFETGDAGQLAGFFEGVKLILDTSVGTDSFPWQRFYSGWRLHSLGNDPYWTKRLGKKQRDHLDNVFSSSTRIPLIDRVAAIKSVAPYLEQQDELSGISTLFKGPFLHALLCDTIENYFQAEANKGFPSRINAIRDALQNMGFDIAIEVKDDAVNFTLGKGDNVDHLLYILSDNNENRAALGNTVIITVCGDASESNRQELT